MTDIGASGATETLFIASEPKAPAKNLIHRFQELKYSVKSTSKNGLDQRTKPMKSLIRVTFRCF